MKRFELHVTPMSEEPLFRLTVIDNKAPLLWMRSSDYEDMTGAEITQTQEFYETIQEMIA